MRRITYLLISLLMPCLGNAQVVRFPYEIKMREDLPLLGAGLVLGGSALYLKSQNPTYALPEPPQLNPYDVPLVERFTLRNWSPTDDKISDALLVGSCVAATGIFLESDARKDWVVLGVMGFETALLTTSLTYNAKWGADRYRPYMYNDAVPWSERLRPDVRESFFSGHTSFCAAATFFSARVWCDYHPREKSNAIVWTAAAVLPALTGIERVRAGKHFPTDVVAGYVAGAAIGYLVPVLHRRTHLKTGVRLRADAGLNGVNLVLQF